MITTVHQPVMGTVMEVRIDVPDDRSDDAPRIDRAVMNEVTRLERMFSIHDPQSELSRWRRGEVDISSMEFVELCALALRWHEVSGGRFNPACGELIECWDASAEVGEVPVQEVLDDIVDAIREPRFRVARRRVVATGDCSSIDLNAIAKGFIVDRALDAGFAAMDGTDVGSLSVNAGGDLCHRGAGSLLVGVENPHRPYDNEPPIARIEISNEGLATSGQARRGWTIGDRWYGHVIDPTFGRPVDRIASLSVIAPDAATADVVATVLSMMLPSEAVTFADSLPSVGCLVVTRKGGRRSNAVWRSHEV